MLPDFPAVRREIARRINRALEMRILKHAPLVQQIAKHKQSEGDEWGIEREGGNMERRKIGGISSKMTMPTQHITLRKGPEIAEKLDELARDVARQVEGRLFTTMHEATDRTGNVVNATGQPFHPSLMWKAMETMQMDFDESGKPIYPTMVVHPDVFKSIEGKIAEWEADPEIKAQEARILEKKREEWRDRENNRKLVG